MVAFSKLPLWRLEESSINALAASFNVPQEVSTCVQLTRTLAPKCCWQLIGLLCGQQGCCVAQIQHRLCHSCCHSQLNCQHLLTSCNQEHAPSACPLNLRLQLRVWLRFRFRFHSDSHSVSNSSHKLSLTQAMVLLPFLLFKPCTTVLPSVDFVFQLEMWQLLFLI